MSDWEIEDMDLAEAQLTRIIEQIGARELTLFLYAARPLNRSTK